jgi:hypothetical protein
VAKVVESLLCELKALSSNPSPAKKKKKEKKKRKGKGKPREPQLGMCQSVPSTTTLRTILYTSCPKLFFV